MLCCFSPYQDNHPLFPSQDCKVLLCILYFVRSCDVFRSVFIVDVLCFHLFVQIVPALPLTSLKHKDKTTVDPKVNLCDCVCGYTTHQRRVPSLWLSQRSCCLLPLWRVSLCNGSHSCRSNFICIYLNWLHVGTTGTHVATVMRGGCSYKTSVTTPKQKYFSTQIRLPLFYSSDFILSCCHVVLK